MAQLTFLRQADRALGGLCEFSRWLAKRGRRALPAARGPAFLVVRPVSLVNPPSAAALAQITAAVGVLNGHALVIASDH